MPNEEERDLDIFGPETVLAFIVAGAADLFFWTIILHYILAIPFYFLTIPRMRHFFPKLLLWLGILSPAPFLVILFILAIIAEKNALARFAEEQAAIFGVGLVTGELGTVVGEAAKGAEVAGKVTKGAVAAGKIVEGGAAAGEATAEGAGAAVKETAKKGGEKAARKFLEEGERREQEKRENEVSPEELGEEKPFFERYQEEMLGTPPEDRATWAPRENRSNEENEDGEQAPGGENVIMRDDGKTVDLRKPPQQ